MSDKIVQALTGPIEMSYKLMNAYLETCPNDIWAETSGGWPVWQQYYHALGAVSFFTGIKVASATVLDQEYASLHKPADNMTISKGDMANILVDAWGCIQKYINSLNDENVLQQNKAVMPMLDMTHAATMSMLSTHALYHLGSCDAALRNHGIPGVF